MFGQYTDFPDKYHERVKVIHVFSSNRIRFFVLQSLCELNAIRETSTFEFNNGEDSAVVTSFEVGIAEDTTFHYMKANDQKQYWSRLTKSEQSSILDFLLIAKYHQNRSGRVVPLRFDHFLLRFIFLPKSFETLVFHGQGVRRIQIHEILTYILERISKKLEEEGFKGLAISNMKVV